MTNEELIKKERTYKEQIKKDPRTAQTLLHVAPHLPPWAHDCREAAPTSPQPSRAPKHPIRTPSSSPSAYNRGQDAEGLAVVYHRDTNLIFIDFLSLLKGKTPGIETN